MTQHKYRVAAVLALVAFGGMTAWALQAQSTGDGARFTNGNNLMRPADFREWQFIGSSLGLTYEEGPPNQNPIFNNVYVNRSAYRAFMESGAWPNGTMFVLEFRRSSTGAEPNTTGRFQTELVGMEAEVKDSRFADGWGYFNFGQANALLDVATPLPGDQSARCVECHSEHGAVERTFVQFYPTLLEVARQKGTVKPGF